MFVLNRLMAAVAVFTAVAFPVAASAEQPAAPPEFVALDEVDPTILHDIRYHEQHNFVGRRVHDYYDPICVLTRPAAEALADAHARCPTTSTATQCSHPPTPCRSTRAARRTRSTCPSSSSTPTRR
jgi:D-alanyl-D-alanine dipeptidase